MGCCCAIALAAIVGCSDQSKDDYSAAGSDLKSAAKETGRAISEDAKSASDTIKAKTKDLGPEVSKATSNASSALDNDKKSLAIQNAIGQRSDLTVKNLRVETNGNKVTLYGNASSHDQMLKVERIAKDVVGRQCVVNDQMTMN